MRLSARPALPLVPFVSLILVPVAIVGCHGGKPKDAPPITAPWTDDFERGSLGGDYHPTTGGDAYRIEGGVLHVSGAYNHPLWLRKKLPRDAVIDVDVWSTSDAGDIKFEAWGDGEFFAKNKGAYTATGYVFVFGGWHNSKSELVRMNEHGVEGKDLVSRTDVKVEKGRHYHWRIVRKGAQIDWYIDDLTKPFLSFTDAAPLEGSGHEYFGFNDWEADLWFDNLTIAPAP